MNATWKQGEKGIEESGPLPGTAKTEEAQREEGRAWFEFLGLLSIIKHNKMQPYSKPQQLHSFPFEIDWGGQTFNSLTTSVLTNPVTMVSKVFLIVF